MFEEAVKRMQKLDIFNQTVYEFVRERKLSRSDQGGMLFYLNEDEEKMVRDWEKETGNLVYHVVHTFTEFGELYSLLFVSKYEDEWEMEHEDIDYGVIMTWTINMDEPMFSEYGSIGFKRMFGGIVRTA